MWRIFNSFYSCEKITKERLKRVWKRAVCVWWRRNNSDTFTYVCVCVCAQRVDGRRRFQGFKHRCDRSVRAAAAAAAARQCMTHPIFVFLWVCECVGPTTHAAKATHDGEPSRGWRWIVDSGFAFLSSLLLSSLIFKMFTSSTFPRHLLRHCE